LAGPCVYPALPGAARPESRASLATHGAPPAWPPPTHQKKTTHLIVSRRSCVPNSRPHSGHRTRPVANRQREACPGRTGRRTSERLLCLCRSGILTLSIWLRARAASTQDVLVYRSEECLSSEGRQHSWSDDASGAGGVIERRLHGAVGQLAQSRSSSFGHSRSQRHSLSGACPAAVFRRAAPNT
jgi:hypothetical protein